MPKRFCTCPNDHCFDSACGDCDADLDPEGYPSKARRRLSNEAGGMVVDIDTGQKFKVKKGKEGKRLVPQLGRTDWKSAQGFANFCLLLSCLGAEGEYVLWNDVADVVMTDKEWRRRGFKSFGKPPVRHCVCKQVVTSTAVYSLQKGQGIGCKCNSNHANHWRHRRPEVVQRGKERGFEVLTTEGEWVRDCHGNSYCPKLRCIKCKQVVTSTSIDHLQQGQGIGCKCNLTMASHWRHRRSEVVQWGKERGFEVLTTEEEWVSECHGNTYCPKLRCVECKQVVTSSCISSLQQTRSIGCKCNLSMASHWCHRRSEVVQWGKERGYEVLTTEEEWVSECHGCFYCPKLRCIKCKQVVTSSSINSLQKGQGIGCLCRNKTEAKLLKWLQTKFPDATVKPQYRGPKTDCGGQTHFDFHLAFPDGFEVIIELDGPQHFWIVHHHDAEVPKRDKVKEKWAIARGLSVVRVLQTDVWEDKLDWQGWLATSIEDARTGDARPITPEAPEYRSRNSAYCSQAPVMGHDVLLSKQVPAELQSFEDTAVLLTSSPAKHSFI